MSCSLAGLLELVEVVAPQILLVRVPVNPESQVLLLLRRLAPSLVSHLVLLVNFQVCNGRIQLVQSHLESIVKQTGYQLLQQGARLFETRVRVDLNEPRLALLIYHEVVPENLKAILAVLFVYLESGCDQRQLNNGHDVFAYQLVEVHSRQLRGFLERELVSVLMLAVILVFLLDSVISQVHIQVFEAILVERILLRRHPDVALFEAVALVLVSYQHPQPDIKLSLPDQHGPLDVFLNDKDV